MRISQSKIDEVRASADIVDVISSFVKLKKRGKNFIGLCPFHTEKTPSFNVSAERQMYHCFGCGVGGNAFTFVMEYEKVSFVEAVRTLAERYGISLPAEGRTEGERSTETEALYRVCRMAAKFFHENLMTTVEGQLALEYFRHRGFKDSTIRTFGLGYAMNSWETLINHAEEQKVPMEQLEKAGLVVRREEPSSLEHPRYYDRFRGRAIFPIFSVTGRTIGFGARKLREDDPLGKYINSPETPIYNKSRTLYGLFHAKDAVRESESAILVEGYADLISVFQEGVHNVVASSGTALTEGQIDLLGRYGKTIVLVYDADSAGSQAAMRGVDLIIDSGLEVKVAGLPPGDDPDSFVKKYGGKAFQELVAGAESFLDYKAKAFQSQGLLESPDGRTRAVRSIVQTIARMKDELKRNFYIKNVAEKYGIYETVLFRELEKILGQDRSRVQAEDRRQKIPASSAEQSSAKATRQIESIPPQERDLLKLMLDYGTPMVSFVFSYVTQEVFAHPLMRQAIDMIVSKIESNEQWNVTELVNETDSDELRRFIADVVFNKYEISKGWDEMGVESAVLDPWKMAAECIIFFKIQGIDKLIAENFQSVRESQVKGEASLQYHQQILALQQEKKELKANGLLKGTTPIDPAQ